MWAGKKVSVVLPAFNEEQGVRGAVESFLATGVVDELLVIDNNSFDQTADEVRKTGTAVIAEPIQGYGAALTRGLRESSGELIIMAEADGTFLGRDIYKLLAYEEDFDLVLGTRTTRALIGAEANMGCLLRLGNRIVAKLIRLLYHTCPLSDCGCTLRLIHRPGLQKILPSFTVRGSHFLPEMVILAKRQGLRMIEVPVNYRERKGKSKITGSWKGTLTTGWNMIALALRYRL